MIQITFKCDVCKCEKGQVQTLDRDTVVECENCKRWEVIDEEKL